METVPIDPPSDPFSRLARELASRPDLILRLLADHPANGETCRGCTTPGGQMMAAVPCSIRTLALLADEHARSGR